MGGVCISSFCIIHSLLTNRERVRVLKRGSGNWLTRLDLVGDKNKGRGQRPNRVSGVVWGVTLFLLLVLHHFVYVPMSTFSLKTFVQLSVDLSGQEDDVQGSIFKIAPKYCVSVSLREHGP